jgi:hypothetical protein
VPTAQELADRLKQATDELRADKARIAQLADERTTAVNALHDEHGWSWDQIAKAMGTSQQQACKIGLRSR